MTQEIIELRYEKPYSYLSVFNYETRDKRDIPFVLGKLVGGEIVKDTYKNGETYKKFRIYLEQQNGIKIPVDLKQIYMVLYSLSCLFNADPSRVVKISTQNIEKEGKEYTNLIFSQGGVKLHPKLSLNGLNGEQMIEILEKEFINFIDRL